MRNLNLTILQELARLETAAERKAVIREILELLEEFVDAKLVLEEEDAEIHGVNPFECRILWSQEEAT